MGLIVNQIVIRVPNEKNSPYKCQSKNTYSNYTATFVCLTVQELGIKELLPAYSDPNLQPQDLVTGVCFASGGTGFDPMTPKIVVQLIDEYSNLISQIPC